MLDQKMGGVKITNKLPGEMIAQAAEVYYGEFRQKYNGLLLIPRSEEQALRILRQSMDLSKGFFALDNQGNLLGLVGLGYRDGGFVKYKWDLLLKEFGFFGAVMRKVIKFFEAPGLKKDHMRIEGIVVTERAQGKGIGTALLNEVFEQAKQEGFKSIHLEVINTNPRARSLYHRLGFKDTGRVFYGPLTLKAGFTWIWRMEKSLEHQPQKKPCLRHSLGSVSRRAG